MDPITFEVPAYVARFPNPEQVFKTTPVSYHPAEPGQIQIGLDDRILWVSRDGWRAGTEALHIEPDGGKRIFPAQFGDVHWTVVQAETPDLPVLQLYVLTWRVVEIVARTCCLVPRGWESDFAGLADDVEFNNWRRSLAGAS